MKRITGILVVLMFMSVIYASSCWATDNNGENRENLGNPAYAHHVLEIVHAYINTRFMLYGQLHQLTDEELYSCALKGMVSSLGDPYSEFLTPKEVMELRDSQSNHYLTGVGVHLRLGTNSKGDTNVIMFPYPGSPAAKAGIKSGDILQVIDDSLRKVKVSDPLISKDYAFLETINSELQGEKGKRITLTVSDAQNSEPKKITIICDSFWDKSVSWKMTENGTAVIRIYSFENETEKDFQEAILAVLKAGAKRLIVDLRDNTGGYTDVTVKIASHWIGDRTVYIWKNRNNEESPVKGDEIEQLESMKTALLVNGETASASEILCGALRSYKKAVLAGQKTFGKGVVQSIFPLPDGSALYLTTEKWLTPQGETIHGKGFKPDVEIDLDKGESEIIKEVENLLQ